MRRLWLLVASLGLVVVVLIALNSGPVTSTQALRAARATPSTIEAPSAPFCRALADQQVDAGSGYLGSDDQLVALSELEAAATPTVRLRLGVIRHYVASGERSSGGLAEWPAPVQDAVASVEAFADANC